ncbi:MAG: DNA (cytosine-5-)-methyltransferase [Bacteroidales bacterium]|nr:DNA (cytosine-5-)-methyltransferase [Bacteroidales bacterium]
MALRFIDLFAGLSGIRIGFEQAAKDIGVETQCLLTSEIKPGAIEALQHRYPGEKVDYNIYDVHAEMIPQGVDVLLGGFPCQPFSAAGKGLGFLDTRGTLFFEIERLIHEFKEKKQKPGGFILENVEGLMKHGGAVKNSPYGKTLTTIVKKLELAGYNVEVLKLDSADFGVAQSRKRIYIVGIDKHKGKIDVDNLPHSFKTFGEIKESGLPTDNSLFAKKLLSHFKPEEIEGKYIKDKRGGERNIHSWDLELRGTVTKKQKEFLNLLLKERRKKKWANIIGIDWMDGMPLTTSQISTFYDDIELQDMLNDLVQKGYLVYEHPKKRILLRDGNNIGYRREPDLSKPKGYNIVTGKLSFKYSQFLNSKDITPTLVAMDMSRVGVVDGNGIRHLSITEGLRLFGYDDYDLSYLEGRKKGQQIAFDLLGNSVCVPVIKVIADRLIRKLIER